MEAHAEDEGSFDWTKLGVQVAAVWIAAGLGLSFLLKVRWVALGDFSYATAMHYHGLMVPLLVMFYLLTIRVWPVKMRHQSICGVVSIVAVLLAGPAALARSSEGLSVAAALQISGMAITDLLGLALLVALARVAMKGPDEQREPRPAVWLLLSSVAAVLFAAPIGHIAGWASDLGISTFPGMTALTRATGMTPQDFQEGLVSSHSHLIVAATLTGLIALATRLFRYERLLGWRKRLVQVSIWLMLISICAAAAIYVISALTGWEPPALFVSGPNGENGVPIDDVALSISQIASLLLIGALIGVRGGDDGGEKSWTNAFVRTAVFLNCICSFIGAVVFGLYIEFHEAFYGGGEAPALGAANDQAFIRAHLLYAFLLLPIVLVFLIAVGSQRGRSTACRAWSLVFAVSSVGGMTSGLAGEFLWMAALDESTLLSAMLIIAVAVIAGAASLLCGHLPTSARLRTTG